MMPFWNVFFEKSSSLSSKVRIWIRFDKGIFWLDSVFTKSRMAILIPFLTLSDFFPSFYYLVLLVRSNNPVSSFSCKIEFKELVMNRMEFTAEPCLTIKILSTGERQTNIKYMITGNNW